jgi:hypothetical protein
MSFDTEILTRVSKRDKIVILETALGTYTLPTEVAYRAIFTLDCVQFLDHRHPICLHNSALIKRAFEPDHQDRELATTSPIKTFHFDHGESKLAITFINNTFYHIPTIGVFKFYVDLALTRTPDDPTIESNLRFNQTFVRRGLQMVEKAGILGPRFEFPEAD